MIENSLFIMTQIVAVLLFCILQNTNSSLPVAILKESRNKTSKYFENIVLKNSDWVLFRILFN